MLNQHEYDKPAQQNYLAIGPQSGSSFDLKQLWEYRELLYFFIWRDIKVRYKQTVIGVFWAILKPLAAMVVFSVILGNFARMPSDGLPYPIFLYAGLLPWNYFSEAISAGGMSVVASSNLVSKIYFPRLIIPLASVITPFLDFFLSFLVLLGLMLWFSVVPTWKMLMLPLFLFCAALTALSVSLWVSALNVKYRDVGHAISFAIQFLMFASPVVYPSSLVPQNLKLLYMLNPMVSIIEGFRWALLSKSAPDFWSVVLSLVIVLALLIGGMVYFRHMERTFADVI